MISKYEELVNSLSKSVSDYQEAKINCFDVILTGIIKGFATYLGQEYCVHLVDEDFELPHPWPKSPQWPTGPKSMSYREDGFWHFGIVLNVSRGALRGYSTIKASIKRNDDGGYTIKLPDSANSQWKINADMDFRNLHDHLFVIYKAAVESTCKPKPKSNIGFHIRSEDDALPDF